MRELAPVQFHVVDRVVPGSGAPLDLGALTIWHNAWFRYVTGDAAEAPFTFGARLFTADEYAHMADVRRVFIAFRVVAIAAGAVGLLQALRVARRGRTQAVVLIRDAAIVAAAGVAAIAVGAAVAFDRLFLLFHEVFFPQGNFLFGPDSNLLAMYPDQYWYGVTLRIGFSFAVATAIIATAATATLRRARRLDSRT
jgi:uncharacterized membrane protein